MTAFIHYECFFTGSKAGYERFGRALIEYGVRLHNTFVLDRRATVAVLVSCKPEVANAFAEALKMRPGEIKYKPPTVFDNGTLVAIYASAEDELADKKTEWAKRALEKAKES